MSKTDTNPQSELGAGERKPSDCESAGPEMKQAMAQMMANCPCGPEMMAKMASLMGGCSPSQPTEPTQEKPTQQKP